MSPNATMAVNPSFSKEGFVTGAGSEPEDADDFVPNSGTVLEAAFVDPAYAGNGSSLVDLQAPPSKLLTSSGVSNPSVRTRETVTTSRCGLLQCCKNTEEQVVVKPYSELSPNEKAILHSSTTKMSEKDRARMIRAQEKAMRQAQRDRERYNDVPDGLLIYRLDTHAHAISLVSAPSAKTNEKTLTMHMIIASAMPGPERTRKTIILTGVDGTRAVLTACEQRTAISWLEAIEMMLGNTGKGRSFFGRKSDSRWASEDLGDEERNQIEDRYVNLAAYSNKLIRAGETPGREQDDEKTKRKQKKNKEKTDASGKYYSVTKHREDGKSMDEEALESIAKRRAVIKDSWDFYRMISSLLRDKRKYDEVFRKMTTSPVFPYLNSMTGLNDPGDTGYENTEKSVLQRDFPEYASMTRTQVVQNLVSKANEAQQSLVEICKALAGSLGMEEVGVGPVKEVSAAIRKAEKKYNGDVLKVTDYCRALLVVKDFPTLLALLELARDSFGPLIRRVKLSSLKSDHRALPGGYRDCKINLELKEHVCEIQVHVWPMWVICGVDGFRHYRHCLEYSTDSFINPYDSLDGLDRKTVAELVVMAEEAVADMPLDSLEWYHEKYILDYFAEVGLFMKHGLDQWAETTLRELIRLRCESPDIGPNHHETRFLKQYLVETLQAQGRNNEAFVIINDLEEAEKAEVKELEETPDCFTMSFCTLGDIMDPNRSEREEEESAKREVRESKKAWRRIREDRFKFLAASSGTDKRQQSNV